MNTVEQITIFKQQLDLVSSNMKTMKIRPWNILKSIRLLYCLVAIIQDMLSTLMVVTAEQLEVQSIMLKFIRSLQEQVKERQ